MGRDIRDLLKDYEAPKTEMSKGHEARFEARLAAELGQKQKPSFLWLKVAAVAIVFFSLGYFGYQQLGNQQEVDPIIADVEQPTTEVVDPEKQITLGDISPDLKKIEDFYTNGINLQLASLEEDDENKELIDGYLQRLDELNVEYNTLNEELNKVGPTEATITALVDNLQLRLELLFRLKNKLKELKDTNNEQLIDMQA
ncbi:hypothetical protein [Aureitalea marina]|uniref:Uncharacterized protein n=1 Tax=Aureitalea marina TaxID=930804 RepID=A0A2S7KMM2_9FLAO|nr:hypothetical protein [Aureitalea marina]PQB03851.1 hypothetical protein BST85_02230 [Aureitalea marina]